MNNILEYLDRAVDLYGDRTVYTDGTNTLSFEGLRAAARVIGRVVAETESPERPVAVLAGRHVYTPACYLGIAMAGCFYAPMDPGVPDARLLQIMDVVKADTMIADRAHSDKARELGFTGNIIVMEDLLEELQGDEQADEVLAERRAAITETTPLYVLFTSGSTGKPKGVLTSHQAMICYLDGLQDVIGLDETDVLGNQAPLDYIAAIRDMYLPLMTGAQTVMLDPSEFAMPQRLMESLASAGVTTLCWSATGLEIPARLGAFDGADSDIVLPPLRRVVFSGSVISNPLLRKWQEAFSETTFINQYGPTEATGSCTYHVIDHTVTDDEVIPIGRPYKHYNIELLALDAESDGLGNIDGQVVDAGIDGGTSKNMNGQPRARRVTSAGEVGEICVKGPALALGYYDAPEQTEKSFALNPLQTHWKEILYHTGDLGRYDEQGVLYYLGRKDRQFKHLGHRIEPEEIEQKAMTMEGVTECSCTYNQECKQIHLFYTGDATSREITLFLRSELPSFMAPRKIIKMDELPRLPNGKLDRKALEVMTSGK